MSAGKSDSESEPLSAAKVGTYWDKLNDNTGGRLSEFAATGTAPTEYTQLAPEQIQALGGLGATQVGEVERMRSRALEEAAANPSLSVYQQQRVRQLTDEDAADRLAAIAKQTEGAITGLASQEHGRQFDADRANAAISRDDLQALANIFFGGKGQKSESSSFNFGL